MVALVVTRKLKDDSVNRKRSSNLSNICYMMKDVVRLSNVRVDRIKQSDSRKNPVEKYYLNIMYKNIRNCRPRLFAKPV